MDVRKVLHGPMNKKEFGAVGEEIAAKYLRANGFKIVKRNFRCRMGEIDIIAEKRSDLYFVEVKTRKDNRFGTPFESITLNKQRQISKIAKVYLSRFKKEIGCHFSVVGVTLDGGPTPAVNFLEDAFEAC